MSTVALVIIDAQREYGPEGGLAIPGIEGTTAQIQRLADSARQASIPVINVRHVSRDPKDSTFNAGTSGVEFLDGLEPASGEPVVTKQYPGAFTETSLDRLFQRLDVDTVAICGYTSFLCCDSTARQAFELGYSVWYIEDAINEFPIDGLDQSELHRVVSAVQSVMFSEVIKTEVALSRMTK